MATQSVKKAVKGKKDLDLEALSVEIGGNKPPQAINAEEAVISAMLLEPDYVNDALADLSSGSFYSPKCRLIFEAIKTLNSAHKVVDIITVGEQLKADKHLEDVGGYVALTELSQILGAASNIEHYIKILKQKEIQRRLIKASYEILRQSFDDSVNVDDLVNDAQNKVFEATEDTSSTEVEEISAVLDKALQRLNTIQESGTRYTGVRSGFKTLDEVTGGFQPSDMIILAARPSVGKTAFVVNIARNAAVDFHTPVAIFSLEMPSIQLANRLIVGETAIDSAKLKGSKSMEPYEWTQLEMKLKALMQAPLYIDATPSLPVSEFRSKAKRLVTQKGVKLIIVDYLQLMQGPSELRGMREQEVAAISRTLKATAKELNVPIIALSQLSRASVQRQTSNNRPQLSDLRESGSIEQDADMVMFIHRADYQGLSDNPDDKGKTTLIIAKHRNGEIGDIDLLFRSSEVKFVDVSDALVNQAAVAGGLSSSAINDDGYDSAYQPSDDFGNTPVDYQ